MNKTKSNITCIVTMERLGCRPEIYQKRIEKAGSEEELHRTYVGRRAKQLLREGKTVAEIRKSLNVSGDCPEVPQDVLDSITSKKPTNKTTTNTGSITKKSKKTQKQMEKDIQASVEVDEDVLDFIAKGDAVDLGVFQTA